jgi:signal transduction histidine kinase
MLARLRTFFVAPVFEGDEEKTRVARLLNIILITVMALVMVFSVPALLLTPEFGRVAIELVLAVWALFMLVLLRRGAVRPAGFLLSLTLWVVVSYGTYEAGGFRGSTMSSYFGIVLIAELLLGARAGLVFGVASIAVTGLMAYADSRGWMPPPASYATLSTFWIEFSVVVIGVVALLSLITNSLRQALERARRNEKELSIKVEEIQVLARKAIEANEFKTDLIARISHELRTPLGAVLGMAEMLQQDIYGPLTPAQHDIAKRIVNNSQALGHVFAELLDQSQIESGQLRLRADEFSPQALAQAVHSNCLPLAQQKGLALRVDVDPNLPVTVIGDKNRIEQILSNLVVNAVKFTDAGSVVIHVGTCNDTQWTLRVKDTGIGISPETQAHIFEPFRQADETTGRKYGGVGLGLAIVHQLVTAMHGTVSVESEVGRGSTFTVVLPLRATQPGREIVHE